MKGQYWELKDMRKTRAKKQTRTTAKKTVARAKAAPATKPVAASIKTVIAAASARRQASSKVGVEANLKRLSKEVAEMRNDINNIDEDLSKAEDGLSKVNIKLKGRKKPESNESLNKLMSDVQAECLSLQDEVFRLKTGVDEKLAEIKQEMEGIERNVRNLFEMANKSVQYEASSGTRKSPFAKIADEGVIGPPLPGSFESRK